MNEILVTVCCSAYNHEKYISDALEGFVNQKTTFKYEVIVHDDASTDGTAAIIEEYAKKYPQIIIPIFQKENLYKRGINRMTTYVYPLAHGKYFALCEGDDYWIDPYKLQKQVDYMEKHEECTFCFTNAYIENLADNNRRRAFVPYSDREFYEEKNKIVTMDEIYQLSFIPTASFMFRKKDYERLPADYWLPCPTGDLRYRLYFTSFGYSYFLNDKTCVYRENVPGSAMTTWKREKRSAIYDRSKKIVDMIERVDKFSEEKHSYALRKIQDIHIGAMLSNATSKDVFNDLRCRRVFAEYSLVQKIKIRVKILIPDVILNRCHR